MQSIYDELSIEIFKYNAKPINLFLTNKKWYNIFRDLYAQIKWLIYKYDKAHALFYAVRLGNYFITEDVIQALFSKNVILFRYFIQ